MSLTQGQGRYEKAEAQMEKRCKPDFETMIKRANEQLTKNTKLANALFDYFADNVGLSDKVYEFIGELAMESRRLTHRIDELIKQEESWEE